MSQHPKTMSGAEFRAHFAPLLDSLQDDDQVFFGFGDLSFCRTKDRGPQEGPRLFQIEFNEIYSTDHTPDSTD